MNEELESENEATTAERPAETKPKKRKWIFKTFLSLVILVCGIVIGVVGSVLVIQYKIRNFQFQPEFATNKIMTRLSSKYDLTDSQTTAIQKIVAEHFNEVEGFGQEFQSGIEQSMDSVVEKISSEMTEQQAKDWREKISSIRSRFFPQQPFREPIE